MNLILSMLCLVVVGLGFGGICFIKKNHKLKKSEGKLLLGKKLSHNPLMGRPTWYIVEVEYVIDNVINKRKILTTDRRVMECKNNEPISLLYVEKNNKIYWAEEKSFEYVLGIVLLSMVCGFALLLAAIVI